jgi:hypothetical protein
MPYTDQFSLIFAHLLSSFTSFSTSHSRLHNIIMFGIFAIVPLLFSFVSSVQGHGLITGITGANGLNGQGFAVVDGTPRNTGLPIKSVEVGAVRLRRGMKLKHMMLNRATLRSFATARSLPARSRVAVALNSGAARTLLLPSPVSLLTCHVHSLAHTTTSQLHPLLGCPPRTLMGPSR